MWSLTWELQQRAFFLLLVKKEVARCWRPFNELWIRRKLRSTPKEWTKDRSSFMVTTTQGPLKRCHVLLGSVLLCYWDPRMTQRLCQGTVHESERGSAVGYLNFWALTDSAYKSRSSWTSLAEPTALSLRHLLGLHDFLSFGYEVPEKDAVARPLRLHFFYPNYFSFITYIYISIN